MNEEAKLILRNCMSEKCFHELGEEKIDVLDNAAKETERLRERNSFLGSDENSKFITFDLPKGISCPGKTSLCSIGCYQGSVEKRYQAEKQDSAITAFRKLNWYLSTRENFTERILQEILGYQTRHLKVNQQLYIRLHASGDFYSLKYMMSWMEIALATKLRGKDYVFVAYTKSFRLLDELLSNQEMLRAVYIRAYNLAREKVDISLVENLGLDDFNIHIIASVMDDTFREYPGAKEIIQKWKLPVYKVIYKKAQEVQEMENCGNKKCVECLKCYKFPMSDVETELRLSQKDKKKLKQLGLI